MGSEVAGEIQDDRKIRGGVSFRQAFRQQNKGTCKRVLLKYHLAAIDALRINIRGEIVGEGKELAQFREVCRGRDLVVRVHLSKHFANVLDFIIRDKSLKPLVCKRITLLTQVIEEWICPTGGRHWSSGPAKVIGSMHS